jgi:hypothetical protein
LLTRWNPAAQYYLTRLEVSQRKAVEVIQAVIICRGGIGPPWTLPLLSTCREFQTDFLKPAERIPTKLTKPGFGGFDTMQLAHFQQSWADECPEKWEKQRI